MNWVVLRLPYIGACCLLVVVGTLLVWLPELVFDSSSQLGIAEFIVHAILLAVWTAFSAPLLANAILPPCPISQLAQPQHLRRGLIILAASLVAFGGGFLFGLTPLSGDTSGLLGFSLSLIVSTAMLLVSMLLLGHGFRRFPSQLTGMPAQFIFALIVVGTSAFIGVFAAFLPLGSL